MLIRVLLSFMIVVAGTAPVYAQEKSKHRLVALDGFDCLAGSMFGLSNIKLRMPEADVVRKLGKPKSTTKGWGEDDGGRHDIVTYHYATLNVDIVRGRVDRIHTNSPEQKTTEGIKVGDGRQMVTRKLGAVPRGWKNDELRVSVVICPENTKEGLLFRDDYVAYQFTPDGRLVTITYEVVRP